MAKNFIQDGNTISITNNGNEDIVSGSAVAVGDLIAVAVTDIPGSGVGDGLVKGVFQLPKLSADVVPAGAKVYLASGTVQLEATDAVFAGYAWEAAGAGDTVIDVKING